MKNDHIVYAAFDSKGNCLYVGEGKPDRYKHITSGTSHVYEANRWHFSGKEIVIDILHKGLTKKDAISTEQKEITRLKPAWNKCEYGTLQLMDMCKFVTKRIKEFVRENPRYQSKMDFYISLSKDLCKLLNKDGVTTIIQGQKWTASEIPVGFMSHLSKDGDKYYPVLKHIFDISRNETERSYIVKLRGWENEE